MRGIERALVFLLLCPALFGLDGAQAQVLRGRVVDMESGLPLPSASIKLVHLYNGLSQSRLTNQAGRFQLEVDSEGPFILDVFALGFEPYVDTLRVPETEERIDLEIRLGVDAIPLDPLEVTASRSPWWELTEPRMLWPFFERKDLHEKLGLGKYYDRDDLKMMFAAGPLSLFVEIWPPRAQAVSMSLMGRPCEYTYYLDGMKWAGTLAEIPYRTSDLYSVEIYRGPSETPAEFLDSDSRCASW